MVWLRFVGLKRAGVFNEAPSPRPRRVTDEQGVAFEWLAGQIQLFLGGEGRRDPCVVIRVVWRDAHVLRIRPCLCLMHDERH